MSCSNCKRLQAVIDSKTAYIAYLREKFSVG